MRARTTLAPLALLAALACSVAPRRFALRPPVAREPDDRPFAPPPREEPEYDMTYGMDTALLRPLSHALLFERGGEARNVNALDEVPDSTWYTNRAPTPAEVREGACRDVPEPRAPYDVVSTKQGGITPGFFVIDALGRRFAFKFDQHPLEQPELNTGADVAASRLYWALGYNTPCNTIAYVRAAELRLTPRSYRINALGRRVPLTRPHIDTRFSPVLLRPDGSARLGASLFVAGEALGPHALEGVRRDDPNDQVPHEHRRELRGERLLAAWLNHWDARGPNSLDSFVRDGDRAGVGSDRDGAARGGGGEMRAGHVVHYFIDFGDCLGSRPDDLFIWRRMGHGYMYQPAPMFTDLVTLGLLHRPWDELAQDPVLPYLNVSFDAAHFAPERWLPANPAVQFSFADAQDVGWMARKIARLGREHLRAALDAARFSDPRVPARLLELLLARRARALRWAFARSSPLADLAVTSDGRLCARDLAVEAGVSDAARVRYAAELRAGRELSRYAGPLRVSRGEGSAGVCVGLPELRVAAGVPAASAERYAVLDLVRSEGASATRLRAHFYDLGAGRGFALVGVER